jgi:hypothetical protein
MKPLIRYTIGDVSSNGISCLYESIQRIKKLYPECDVCVCYNQIDFQVFDKWGVELVDQRQFIESLPLPPNIGFNVHWKLYPPRLRPESHEIFIDNDILLHRRVDAIDGFLSSSKDCLVYQGLHGLYGFFRHFVPGHLRINSGIFGLPPLFDLSLHIRNAIQNTHFKRWSGKFDEQGLIAYTLTQNPYRIISLAQVPILESNWDYKDHLNNKENCGFHFVGLNVDNEHQAWSDYHRSMNTLL